MLDRLTGMEVFARVAAAGSLSAAGRDLRLSQTMVTKHIAALEKRLGVRLFHRTTRRLSLTEAGRAYLDASTRLLTEIAETEAAISAESITPRGLLRLNAPVSFGARQIAPLLADFARRAPELRVELALNDRLVDLAEEGWDLAIRVGSLRDSQLVARRLAPAYTVVCASPAYLAARGTPRTVAELPGHDCLGYTLSQVTGARRWVFGHRGEVGVTIAGPLSANNGDALRAAAVAGLGLIYEPSFLVVDELRAGTLVRVELDHPTVEFGGIYAVWLPQPRRPAKVGAMVDFLAERFAGMPPWEADRR